jgi:uncharacterized protein (DUF1697 family)
MQTWVTLLRAVNLGKVNKVPMADLRAGLTAAGFMNVRTYIQSGNILLDTPESNREAVSVQVQELIQREFGVSSPAVMVSPAELAAAVEHHPYLERGADPKALRIMFLADEPDAERIASLDPDRSPGHRFTVEGRVIWLYIPQLQDSRLTNDYFDRRLGTVSTLRNVSTCEAILKLLDAG